MEGRAHGKHYGAARAFCFGESRGFFDGGERAGDDGLAGRVEVGGGDGLACFGFGFAAGFGYLRRVQSQDGGHGALTRRDGQLHGAAAGSYGADGIGKAEGSGGYVRGPLA